ncbi:MAG: ImmA/IrrE family metallo-endopeptidase [Bryobacteraceae bacterium]|nr:ImmA/IrrE family metallo-endopeptidase [Bryobacteraceae bacterium]
MPPNEPQGSLFDTEATRSLLDQLLSDSRLYTQSKDFKDLLDFVARMRNFAPFNAMLLQVQKPGLRFAASAHDWKVRFERKPKEGARPLLILWPFSPVALVYDVVDTEGRDLPRDVWSFYAHGAIDRERIAGFQEPLRKKNIDWAWVDAGDGSAGWIRVLHRATEENEATQYRMCVNRNLEPAIQLTTIAHELGHLFLGHLGLDRKLSIPDRRPVDHGQAEIEAESVAYMICGRNGISSASEVYLKDYVQANTTLDDIDIYQVMRAAGQVESLLSLTTHTRFEKPGSRT